MALEDGSINGCYYGHILRDTKVCVCVCTYEGRGGKWMAGHKRLPCNDHKGPLYETVVHYDLLPNVSKFKFKFFIHTDTYTSE